MEADLSSWALLSAANRWALYALMLASAGTALFVLITPIPQRVADIALELAQRIAPVTALAYIAAVGLGGAEMMAGPLETLWDLDTWSMAGGTSLGTSALIGVPAMILLWAGAKWRRKPLMALGAAGGIASFLVTGHAAIAKPVWLAGPSVALHLVGAAYWMGALYPLHRSLRDLDISDAASVIAAFSRYAVGFVCAIILSGVIISWIQIGEVSALWETTYGLRLSAKIILFGLVFALAGLNKLVLTPMLDAGKPAAPPLLRRVIVVEYSLIILILGAAVSLTMTEPPRKQTSTPVSVAPHTE
jgi:putative copper export protein